MIYVTDKLSWQINETEIRVGVRILKFSTDGDYDGYRNRSGTY